MHCNLIKIVHGNRSSNKKKIKHQSLLLNKIFNRFKTKSKVPYYLVPTAMPLVLTMSWRPYQMMEK